MTATPIESVMMINPLSRLLAHRAHGSAYFVVARRGKSASAPSMCIARSAR
jgi:hypothetical protein